MADKEMPIDVSPVLPEDVNAGKVGPAPPSYEEVMGQYVTSLHSDQSERPSLAYIDIMPMVIEPGNMKAQIPPKFQPFSDIVRGANVWLSHNPGLSVWKCETVERKVLAGQGQGQASLYVDLDTMSYKESIWGCNCFVFGVRLWLTPTPADQKGVQEIGLVNITPTPKEIKYTQYHMHGGLGFRHRMATARERSFWTYEGLKKSLDDFNGKIKDNPIPGTILNVETATLKFADIMVRDSAQNVAEMSSWHEMSGMTGRRLTQVLRVFYIKGPPTAPKIEFQEFLPTQLTQPSWGKPIRFADFQDVEQKVANWLKGQSGMKILNIETREAKYAVLFNQGFEINTDCTDDFDFPAFSTNNIRFLRVFYAHAASVPSFAHTAMTARLFPPIRLKGLNRFETMGQTMQRIDAWLKVTKLPIFGVETISVLDEGSISFQRAQYSIRGLSGKTFVTAIRLYFPSFYTEPSPELLPPLPKEASNGKSGACNIL